MLLTNEEAEGLRLALASEDPEAVVDWHERTGHEGPTILAQHHEIARLRSEVERLQRGVEKVRDLISPEVESGPPSDALAVLEGLAQESTSFAEETFREEVRLAVMGVVGEGRFSMRETVSRVLGRRDFGGRKPVRDALEALIERGELMVDLDMLIVAKK